MMPAYHLPLFLALSLLNMAYAPRLDYLERFAHYSPADISDVLYFNIGYQDHLFKLQWLYPSNENIVEAQHEAKTLQEAWVALSNARSTYNNIVERRVSLNRLLTLIGPEAFLRGEMPVHVPFWRFTGVRVP